MCFAHSHLFITSVRLQKPRSPQPPACGPQDRQASASLRKDRSGPAGAAEEAVRRKAAEQRVERKEVGSQCVGSCCCKAGGYSIIFCKIAGFVKKSVLGRRDNRKRPAGDLRTLPYFQIYT